MSAELETAYFARHQAVLLPVATTLEGLVRDYLAEVPRIDRVSVRAKSPRSFLDKARRVRTDGSPKYSDPLGEIQDQIGARVIVFYTSDVDNACDAIQRYFRHIEMLVKAPPSDAEFGYFGRHYVLPLPPDAVPREIELRDAPPVFELQVRTLFQHAWSEAEHDLGYKPTKALTPDHNRKFAFTAAQAWGADMIFQELHNELSPGS